MSRSSSLHKISELLNLFHVETCPMVCCNQPAARTGEEGASRVIHLKPKLCFPPLSNPLFWRILTPVCPLPHSVYLWPIFLEFLLYWEKIKWQVLFYTWEMKALRVSINFILYISDGVNLNIKWYPYDLCYHFWLQIHPHLFYILNPLSKDPRDNPNRK